MPGTSVAIQDHSRFQLHNVYVTCKIQGLQTHGRKRFIIIKHNPRIFFLLFMANDYTVSEIYLEPILLFKIIPGFSCTSFI